MRDFAVQKKLILAGLAILLVADVTFEYLTMRLSGSREDRGRVLLNEGRQVAIVRADVKRASEIREKTPELIKQLDEFEGSLLPASKGYSVVTQETDQYAKESHVLLENVRFKEDELKGRNLTELKAEMSVSGDYGSIVQFLNRLQRSKSVYIVDGLDLDVQNPGQGPVGSLKVNLHLRTYFRKA
jgi:Type II secretion system (T2SS), protein M subtype b